MDFEGHFGNLLTLVTLCAQLMHDLLLIAKFVVVLILLSSMNVGKRTVFYYIMHIVSVLLKVMVFVHARNETVRTASVLCEMAKNNGQITMFAAEKSAKLAEALKQVSSGIVLFTRHH